MAVDSRAWCGARRCFPLRTSGSGSDFSSRLSLLSRGPAFGDPGCHSRLPGGPCGPNERAPSRPIYRSGRRSIHGPRRSAPVTVTSAASSGFASLTVSSRDARPGCAARTTGARSGALSFASHGPVRRLSGAGSVPGRSTHTRVAARPRVYPGCHRHSWAWDGSGPLPASGQARGRVGFRERQRSGTVPPTCASPAGSHRAIRGTGRRFLSALDGLARLTSSYCPAVAFHASHDPCSGDPDGSRALLARYPFVRSAYFHGLLPRRARRRSVVPSHPWFPRAGVSVPMPASHRTQRRR